MAGADISNSHFLGLTKEIPTMRQHADRILARDSGVAIGGKPIVKAIGDRPQQWQGEKSAMNLGECGKNGKLKLWHLESVSLPATLCHNPFFGSCYFPPLTEISPRDQESWNLSDFAAVSKTAREHTVALL